MKINTLRRHFRESFKSIARNGWMTFASISAVTVTLLLVGVFLVIMMNLNHIADNVQNDVEMKVYVDNAADSKTKTAIGHKIEAISEVDTVVFSNKENELDHLIDDLGREGKKAIIYQEENGISHDRILPQVNAVGWNEHFIIAKQTPFKETEKVN